MHALPDDVLREVLRRAWGKGDCLDIDGSAECAQRRALFATSPRFTHLLKSMPDLHRHVDAACDAVAASFLAIVGPSVTRLTLRYPTAAGMEPRETAASLRKVLQHLSNKLLKIDLRVDADGDEDMSLPRNLRRMRVEYDARWLGVAMNSGCTRLRNVEFVTQPASFEFDVLRFCALMNQLRSVRRLALVGVSVEQAKQVQRHLRADIVPRFVVVMEGEDVNLLQLGELGVPRVRACVQLRHDEYPPCFAYPCDEVEDFRLVLDSPQGTGVSFSVDAVAPAALRGLHVAAENCTVALDFEATFANLGAGRRRDISIRADAIVDIGTLVVPNADAEWTLRLEARSLPMAMLFALRRAGAAFEVQDAGCWAARAVVASRPALLTTINT